MPGEEGFPAYLSARLSEFYERAGRADVLSGYQGSVSVVGAVSPPGGDLSEPVTQGTLRIVRVFWALDSKLRERRHFPAINWLTSYSLYTGTLDSWYRANVAPDFPELRSWAMEILQKEAELQEVVQLVGSDALPEEQKLTLEVAKMIREIVLQQNAFHPVDTYCPMPRQYQVMKTIKRFADLSKRAVDNEVLVDTIANMPLRTRLGKSKFEEGVDRELEQINGEMDKTFEALGGK
jgi:V/A-type H+-transporting ATPase subunit A